MSGSWRAGNRVVLLENGEQYFPRVFAAILMILVLSVMFDVLARALERRTLAWQTAGRRPRAGAPPRANRRASRRTPLWPS